MVNATFKFTGDFVGAIVDYLEHIFVFLENISNEAYYFAIYYPRT